MTKKSLLMTSLIAIIAYVVYLKAVGLNSMDYSNLFASIKPLIPHALTLVGAFACNLLAYLKGQKGLILGAGIFCVLAALSYFPMSLVMIIPLGFIILAYIKS
jgi:hypothetical protein